MSPELLTAAATKAEVRVGQTKRELHAGIDTILRWRSRYEEEGLGGLKDRPPPDDRQLFPPQEQHKIVALATQ